MKPGEARAIKEFVQKNGEPRSIAVKPSDVPIQNHIHLTELRESVDEFSRNSVATGKALKDVLTILSDIARQGTQNTENLERQHKYFIAALTDLQTQSEAHEKRLLTELAAQKQMIVDLFENFAEEARHRDKVVSEVVYWLKEMKASAPKQLVVEREGKAAMVVRVE